MQCKDARDNDLYEKQSDLFLYCAAQSDNSKLHFLTIVTINGQTENCSFQKLCYMFSVSGVPEFNHSKSSLLLQGLYDSIRVFYNLRVVAYDLPVHCS